MSKHEWIYALAYNETVASSLGAIITLCNHSLLGFAVTGLLLLNGITIMWLA